MFNKLKSINIKGGYFNEETNLDLFFNENIRLSFIFGRNGTGKTSISNAFSCIKNNNLSIYNHLELKDFSSNSIILDDESKKRIYVFNEGFIDENVKFADESGMNTIVMFGEQIELEEDLKKNEELLKKLKQENDNCKSLKIKFDNPKDSISPLFYKNEIIEILKNDYSWAAREQKIKNLARKSSVNDLTYTSIVNLSYKKDVSSDKEELDKNIELLSNINSDSTKYVPFDFKYELYENYIKDLKNILLEKIEKPLLSEREKKIYSMIEKGNQPYIISAKEHFTHENTTFCPFCYQELTGEYKKQLLNEFSTILNENVDRHNKELNSMVISEIEIDLLKYSKLDAELCNKINDLINKTNESIKYVNDLITEKKSNIYVPISASGLTLDSNIEKLNVLFENLKNKIDIYNNNIDNLNRVIERSQELNKNIARNEINGLLESFKKQLVANNENNQKLEKTIQQITQIKKIIDDIKAKKKNFSIALNRINKDLEYVFFGKNRLSVEYRNEKYSVLSYGNNVKLNKLSSGERNVIALCYFFAQILENTNETNNYSNDFFLLIDDPISSFDFENKIGIYSLLRNKLGKILTNNVNNKAIIFTHEIEAMINFEKYKKEFGNEFENKISYLSLINKKISKFENFDKNIYTQSFNIMYEYALAPTDENDLIVGNTMRKVIEAFSTFQCKNTIEMFSRDKDILDSIPELLKEYFHNFMYRLVLNGESHLAEQSITYPDGNFFSYISQSEKQITAKNLICLMYFVNPIHVKKQLANDNQKIDIIKNWVDDLLKEHNN